MGYIKAEEILDRSLVGHKLRADTLLKDLPAILKHVDFLIK